VDLTGSATASAEKREEALRTLKERILRMGKAACTGFTTT